MDWIECKWQRVLSEKRKSIETINAINFDVKLLPEVPFCYQIHKILNNFIAAEKCSLFRHLHTSFDLNVSSSFRANCMDFALVGICDSKRQNLRIRLHSECKQYVLFICDSIDVGLLLYLSIWMRVVLP